MNRHKTLTHLTAAAMGIVVGTVWVVSALPSVAFFAVVTGQLGVHLGHDIMLLYLGTCFVSTGWLGYRGGVQGVREYLASWEAGRVVEQ